jgi:hypothetical protein
MSRNSAVAAATEPIPTSGSGAAGVLLEVAFDPQELESRPPSDGDRPWQEVLADYVANCKAGILGLLEAEMAPDGSIKCRRIRIPDAMIEKIRRRAVNDAQKAITSALNNLIEHDGGPEAEKPKRRAAPPPPLLPAAEEDRAKARQELRRLGFVVSPGGTKP